MVDPDQVYDMVDMTDRIAQGRFFGIFVDESFVEAYLCDATLFGERLGGTCGLRSNLRRFGQLDTDIGRKK